MNLSKQLHLDYDASTGFVRFTMLRLRSRGRARDPQTLDRGPLTQVRRTDLRALCDLLHDFADDLDRTDREA